MLLTYFRLIDTFDLDFGGLLKYPVFCSELVSC